MANKDNNIVVLAGIQGGLQLAQTEEIADATKNAIPGTKGRYPACVLLNQ